MCCCDFKNHKRLVNHIKIEIQPMFWGSFPFNVILKAMNGEQEQTVMQDAFNICLTNYSMI